MSDQIPDPPTTSELAEIIRPLALTVTAAAAGIIWRWAEDAHQNKRFTWRLIVLDLASSIGIGMSAWGVAGWLDLPEAASVAIACGFGTLGRNGVIELILRLYGRNGRNSKHKGPDE